MIELEEESLRALLITLRGAADMVEKLIGSGLDSRKTGFIVYAVEPHDKVPGFFVPGLVIRGRGVLADQLDVTSAAVGMARNYALQNWQRSTERYGEDKGKFVIRGVTLMTLPDYWTAVLDHALPIVHDPENPPPLE